MDLHIKAVKLVLNALQEYMKAQYCRLLIIFILMYTNARFYLSMFKIIHYSVLVHTRTHLEIMKHVYRRLDFSISLSYDIDKVYIALHYEKCTGYFLCSCFLLTESFTAHTCFLRTQSFTPLPLLPACAEFHYS